MRREVERARRYGNELSCLMIDIDRFKAINDSFGHAKGDTVLVAIATCIADASRHSDACARYGGDEFVVLTQLDQPHAVDYARRLRGAVRSLDVRIDQQPVGVTVSIGIATLEARHDDGEDLLRDADSAMYRAKSHGRDRTQIAPLESEGQTPSS